MESIKKNAQNDFYFVIHLIDCLDLYEDRNQFWIQIGTFRFLGFILGRFERNYDNSMVNDRHDIKR